MGAGPDQSDGPALDGSPPGPLADELPSRERFRRFLERRVGGVDHAAWYFDQVLPKVADDPESRLAAEEVVDHVARLMGFETTRHDDEGVSMWRAASGARLFVAVVEAADAVAGLSRAARAGDAMDADSVDHVVGLLCVVTGDEGREALERAVDLRRVSRQVRILGVEALMALARAVARGSVTHALAAAVLSPGASADPIVKELA